MILQSVVRMLCAGLIHGDLSEFNVLVDANGPVIIDLPQVVNAAANNHAKSMLERDVNNLTRFYGQFAPQLLARQDAKEMWALYQDGKLYPETQLTGYFVDSTPTADVEGLMDEINAVIAEKEEQQRILKSRDYD